MISLYLVFQYFFDFAEVFLDAILDDVEGD